MYKTIEYNITLSLNDRVILYSMVLYKFCTSAHYSPLLAIVTALIALQAFYLLSLLKEHDQELFYTVVPSYDCIGQALSTGTDIFGFI